METAACLHFNVIEKNFVHSGPLINSTYLIGEEMRCLVYLLDFPHLDINWTYLGSIVGSENCWVQPAATSMFIWEEALDKITVGSTIGLY